MFFDGWEGMFRVLIIGVLAYILLIFLLRLTGKRILSKMNAFDLVVTVAIGSMLANIVLNQDIPLAEGVLGMGLLIFLQFIISWLSVRIPKFANLIKAQPVLLYYQDRFLEDNMRKERVLEAEILASVRAQGKTDMEQVLGVVLETDGSITVLSKASNETLSALETVSRPDYLDQRLGKEKRADEGRPD